VSRLNRRVVAITGASSGIGRATADRVADEGASVVVSARRTDRLDLVVAGIHARGGKALAVEADVTSEPDMRRLVARAVAAFGRLDVIVCNAGIGYHHAFAETPTSVMRRLVDVNLMGTFYAAHAAMAVFAKQNQGHIIAVSSIVGRRGIAGSSVYSATKAAQLGFIEGLRAEFLGTNFKASIVFPVGTDTEFHDAIERDYGHKIKGRGPRQSAEHVARAIADCIVSPKAEVYPYPKAWLLSVFGAVAPAQADRFVKKFGRRVDKPVS
jgi:short-subunit dehydrogenase